MVEYTLILLLIVATTRSFITADDKCQQTRSFLIKCPFSLPKTRIYHTVMVTDIGINQLECLDRMESFHWSTAIYCQESLFCGMGLDFTRDYSLVSSSEGIPVKETCNILVRQEAIDCDHLLGSFYKVGVLKGRPHRAKSKS